MAAQDIINKFNDTPYAQRKAFSARELISISSSSQMTPAMRTWAFHGLIGYLERGALEFGKDPLTWLRGHMERCDVEHLTVEVLRAFRRKTTSTEHREWATAQIDAKNGAKKKWSKKKPKVKRASATPTAEPTFVPAAPTPQGIEVVSTVDFGIEKPKKRRVKAKPVAETPEVVAKAPKKAKAPAKTKAETKAPAPKPVATKKPVVLNGLDGLGAAFAARQAEEQGTSIAA